MTLKEKLISYKKNGMTNRQKLIQIYSAVEELEQDICGDEKASEEANAWLDIAPDLLQYLDKLIEAEPNEELVNRHR